MTIIVRVALKLIDQKMLVSRAARVRALSDASQWLKIV